MFCLYPAGAVATGTGEVIPESEIRRTERANTLAALELAGWKIYGPGGLAERLEI